MTGMMRRVALMSDIHAQLENFERVIADADAQGATEWWLLGDFVGRGRSPVEVIERIYEEKARRQIYAVAGNHDKMLLGEIDSNMFLKDMESDASMTGVSKKVAEMIQGHHDLLDRAAPEYKRWLQFLPSHQEPQERFMFTHGRFTLMNSGRIDRKRAYRIYTFNRTEVRDQFNDMQQSKRYAMPHFMAVGHTHISGIWQYRADRQGVNLIWGWDNSGKNPPQLEYDEVFFRELHFENLDQQPIFLNPGSVGFPRQHDVAPTYAILTIYNPTEVTIQLRTVENS